MTDIMTNIMAQEDVVLLNFIFVNVFFNFIFVKV